MNTKTVLIHGQDTELMAAWASYLAQDGFAVFTCTDSLEAAEVLSTVNPDFVVISSNNPATFLLLGRILRLRRRFPKVVAVTRIHLRMLKLLLEIERFELLEAPFTFYELKGALRNSYMKPEALQNAYA